jgi:hypothetical protein
MQKYKLVLIYPQCAACSQRLQMRTPLTCSDLLIMQCVYTMIANVLTIFEIIVCECQCLHSTTLKRTDWLLSCGDAFCIVPLSAGASVCIGSPCPPGSQGNAGKGGKWAVMDNSDVNDMQRIDHAHTVDKNVCAVLQYNLKIWYGSRTAAQA